MDKSENKKSLLHKINDVFEDYVVGKLGDLDVLETVDSIAVNASDGSEDNARVENSSNGEVELHENEKGESAQLDVLETVDFVAANTLDGSEDNARAEKASNGETQLTVEADVSAQAVVSSGASNDGWEATPLPARRAHAEEEKTVRFERSSDGGEKMFRVSVDVGEMSKNGGNTVVERESDEADSGVRGAVEKDGAQTERSKSDSATYGSGVNGGANEVGTAVGASKRRQEAACEGDRGNTCPDGFDALWGGLACLRAGFTGLMSLAYYEDVGSLREMQRKICGMQLILQSIAERNGYIPPEVSGECELPEVYGYALRVLRARVLKLYDCMMELVFRGTADYDTVTLCMTLMRLADALRELI